jgi:hypothetical protein
MHIQFRKLRNKIKMILSCSTLSLKNIHAYASRISSCFLVSLLFLASIDEVIPASKENNFERLGVIRSSKLDEISGLQPGLGDDWIVHNDDGKARLHIIDLNGTHKASVRLNEAKNKDWEDLTVIPGPDGPVLVVADTGNNKIHRNSVRLVLTPLPVPDSQGQYPERMDIMHMVKVKYPDGSRDCEAIAYDRIGNQILFMTKQDAPPRLYGIGIDAVLNKKEVTLEFLGKVAGLRSHRL